MFCFGLLASNLGCLDVKRCNRSTTFDSYRGSTVEFAGFKKEKDLCVVKMVSNCVSVYWIDRYIEIDTR